MSVKTIKIGKWTTLEHVAAWEQISENEVIFQISSQSSFSLFAEGCALSTIQALKHQGIRFGASCSFGIDDKMSVLKKVDLFRSLFGISLTYLSDFIIDKDGQDIQKALFTEIWASVIKSKGAIGDGKRRVLVCREPDSPIPDCLLANGQNSLPSHTLFRNVLKTIRREFGGGKGFPVLNTEENVVSYLFEAFRNCHEHGRLDLDGKSQKGIRGIIVEKMIFQNHSEISKRKQLPSLIMDYLDKRWKGNRNMLLISVTVSDYGPGIHHTLHTKGDESPWQILQRAFKPGESSKPQDGSLKRGEGLPLILDSCSELRAFLFVRSTELSGFRDFSDKANQKDFLNRFPSDFPKAPGTSLSLLWPIPIKNPEQEKLFK